MIKIDFQKGSAARQIIRNEFLDNKWELFRKWFFSNFSSKEKDDIQNQFYDFTTERNMIIYFVPWFVSYYIEPYISVIEKSYKLNNGNVLKAEYPPQQSFQMEGQGITMNFKAYSKLFEDNTLQITMKHVNNILEQQNYTNLYLNVIGEQITSLNKRIDVLIEHIDRLKDICISSTTSHQERHQK